MEENNRFRRYDDRDAESVVALDDWTLEETPSDPADIPGREDVHEIEVTYLDTGGEFVVGVVESVEIPAERRRALETFDGVLIAMGGFLPSEVGHDDERTIAGAVELHRMRVAPPCQRAGYGTALLAELERRAAAQDFSHLLATTARRQRSAVAFYPDAGYDRVGTSSYGEYELVHFEKRLD
jgi:GNAT superfamily N-acetyltransferase